MPTDVFMYGVTAVVGIATPAVGTFWARTAYVTVRDRAHYHSVVQPLELTMTRILRSPVRATIPRGPHAQGGVLRLAVGTPMPERARDALTDVMRQQLGGEYDLRFELAGSSPSAEIYLPPQPPERVMWEVMMTKWDVDGPYLGETAQSSCSWDLFGDSPHLGVVGGSGSGKSEIIAWIVAQFMRGGAAVVVLDPKGNSQEWLRRLSYDGAGVLYCDSDAEMYDAVMGLEAVMRYRKGVNTTRHKAKETAFDWTRLVAVLEERNSLQDALKRHWQEIRQTGQPQRCPAIAALDAVLSMGRSFNINVILGAQETAVAAIGRRSNFGAWLVAGRMGEQHWRNLGITKKPAISGKPGRFALVVGGEVEVLQAAYPELDTAKGKKQSDRLAAWATGGDAPASAMAMMKEASAHIPSSEDSILIIGDEEQGRERELVTVSDFAEIVGVARSRIDNAKRGDNGFPQEYARKGNGAAYLLDDMREWWGDR